MDYSGRVRSVQAKMREARADLLVLGPGSNLLYLTGFTDNPFERLLLCFIPLTGNPVFLAPKLFKLQIEAETTGYDVHVWQDVDGFTERLSGLLLRLASPRARILIDEGMPAASLMALQVALPRGRFTRAGPVLASERMRKSPEEVECMRRAAQIADGALAQVLAEGIIGFEERQIASALTLKMSALGAESSSFVPIVGSGPNGAVGHHRPGRRVVAMGDVVILDFGCCVAGYCSDVTRTVVCGPPREEVSRVYETVRAAQEQAVLAVKPGVEAQEIDRVANEMVLQSGLGEWHRTGHGVGLDIHEHPYIVKGNRLVLEDGMTFSVEPGIYLPGRFGVRIEDVVVVTSTGAERLSAFPRSLQTVR
ncbi:MAG: Xaa-Pro peptidase family protein [Candidatus Bipolaricaulota bacterium]|nr:Xaa-Pro peptidase family protein [Candidatus Bipolaricaulota bacterium]